jgi:putative ABC transport system permease protein
MIRNYFKIAIRTLLKYKGYAMINVFGLAIGIASAVLIMLFVQNELSYDDHHVKADRIYRIGLKGKIKNDEMALAVSTSPMASTLKDEYPVVEDATRLQPRQRAILKVSERKFVEKNLFYADSTIFNIFTIPFVKGNPEEALTEPNKAVITESTAKKLFGNQNPIGKVIDWVNEGTKLEVTGVIKDCPETSHFHYNVFVSFVGTQRANSQIWLSNNIYTYVLLQNGSQPQDLSKHFPEVIRKYVGPDIKNFLGVNLDKFEESGNSYGYFLQPITRIHLHSNLDSEIEANGNINNVYFFSVIAVFLILIAAINFMNLSTAKSANRSKEVGIRKVTGARKKQLVFQFLAEAFVISFIALIVAVVFIEIALPHFNNLAQKNLDLNYFSNPIFLVVLILIGVIVGILSGSYPAFYLSSFSPTSVLKGKLQGGAKRSTFRGILVVFQFIITIILFISTIVVSQQMNYVRTKDLGFNKEQVVVLHRANALGNQKDAFRQELLKNPNIQSVSYSRGVPGEMGGSTALYPEGSNPDESVQMNFSTSDNYFDDTYDIEMDEGRYFSEDYSTDSAGVILNQVAAKKLGMEDPVGKKLYLVQPDQDIEFKILGVVKNFNFVSLHNEIRPLFILYDRTYTPELSIKLNTKDVESTLSFVRTKWNTFVKTQPLNYSFLDNTWEEKYRNEQRAGTIFKIFSLLAIFIACLGLLGLASFMAEQRTKEIGVRKVFGASVPNLMKLLSKEIVILIGVSTIIAWPIAYYLMNNWLQDFAFRINLGITAFILASVLAFVVALSTISFRAYQAATTNPAQSLRDE